MSKNAVPKKRKAEHAATPLTEHPSKSMKKSSSDSSPNSPPEISVGFSVGPNKEVVGAVRSRLMQLSPFKKLFENDWDQNYVKNGIDIPLPHINSETFKMLLKLTTGEGGVKLAPEQLFGVISICEDFCIDKLEKYLESYSKKFFQIFEDFIANKNNASEFLNLSSQALKSMLSSDWIPLDEISVFNIACIWAKNQCTQQKLEINGENMRSVLQRSLYEIRFPLMTTVDFSETVSPTNILTDQEKARILEYLVLHEEDRDSSDVVKLGFKINPRKEKVRPYCGTSRVSIFRAFPKSTIVNEPHACVLNLTSNCIRPSSPIELLGVGFLGPIHGDAVYTVNIDADVSDFELETRIPAKMGQIFYCMFEEPLVVVKEIQIRVCLEGPTTQSLTKLQCYEFGGEMEDSDEEESRATTIVFRGVQDGVKFNCKFRSTQIVELVFRRHSTGSSKPT